MSLSMPAAFAVDSGSLDSLENRFFEHTYPKDATPARLQRLEKLVFGEARTGDDQDRLNNLVQATKGDGPGGNGGSSGPGSSESASSGGGSSNTGESSSSSTAPVASDSADSAPASKKKARTDLANYPRVNKLEQTILGKTYEGQPVDERLTRLEQKAFGAQTTIEDLSDRTDRLEEYMASKYPSAAPPSGGSYDNQDFARGGQFQPPSYGGSTTPFTSSPPNYASSMPTVPLDQQVSAMEQKVFGKPEKGQSLTKRVEKLEKSVYQEQRNTSQNSLAERVANLATTLQMSQAAPAAAPPRYQQSPVAQEPTPFTNDYAGQKPPTSYYSQPYGSQQSYSSQQSYGQPSYGTQQSYGSQQSSGDQTYTSDASQTGDSTQEQPQQKQHKHGGSFLGGIAKALVGAGAMAGSALGGMGGMGMGYGMGSMYGGYPGYGSSYGMSPYGGLGGLMQMNSMPYGMGGYGMGGYGMPSYGMGGYPMMSPGMGFPGRIWP